MFGSLPTPEQLTDNKFGSSASFVLWLFFSHTLDKATPVPAWPHGLDKKKGWLRCASLSKLFKACQTYKQMGSSSQPCM